MNKEALLDLLKTVDEILEKSEEEISTKERLEAVKIKMDIIKALNRLKVKIPEKK